jgi:hypothetical protein
MKNFSNVSLKSAGIYLLYAFFAALVLNFVMLFLGYGSVCGSDDDCDADTGGITQYGWPIVTKETSLGEYGESPELLDGVSWLNLFSSTMMYTFFFFVLFMGTKVIASKLFRVTKV